VLAPWEIETLVCVLNISLGPPLKIPDWSESTALMFFAFWFVKSMNKLSLCSLINELRGFPKLCCVLAGEDPRMKELLGLTLSLEWLEGLTVFACSSESELRSTFIK